MYKLILIILALAGTLAGQTLSVASPGNILQVTFTLEDGTPSYQVHRFGREVIRPSRLGFLLKQAPHLDGGFTLVSSDRKSVDETWTQPWGEKKDIRNHYNELRAELAGSGKPVRKMTLVFRVFDDGVGFRYEIPEQAGLKNFEIMDERSEFVLAGNHSTWWIPAYQWNRYEYLYSNTPLSAIDTVHTPLTMETANGLHLSIHEAALTDYASMTLARIDSFRLKADLVPWSDGVKVKTAAPMKTPWRTIRLPTIPEI